MSPSSCISLNLSIPSLFKTDQLWYCLSSVWLWSSMPADLHSAAYCLLSYIAHSISIINQYILFLEESIHLHNIKSIHKKFVQDRSAVVLFVKCVVVEFHAGRLTQCCVLFAFLHCALDLYNKQIHALPERVHPVA